MTESKNREDTTESVVAPIHERWPLTPAEMAVAAQRIRDNRCAHARWSWGRLLKPFLIWVGLALLIELPIKIVLEWVGIVPDPTLFIWLIWLGLLVAMIVAGWRLTGFIRAFHRSRISYHDHEKIMPAIEDREPARVCPICGGDPSVGSPCCQEYPDSWSQDDLHAFWFDIAHARFGEQHHVFDLRRGRRGESFKQRSDVILRKWSLNVRITMGFLIAACFPIAWIAESSLYASGLFWSTGICAWWSVFILTWYRNRALPELGRKKLDTTSPLNPGCRKCKHHPDDRRDGRCPECGTAFSESPPRFYPSMTDPFNPTVVGMFLLAASPFIIPFVGTVLFVVAGIRNPIPNAAFGNSYSMVSDERLIGMMGRPMAGLESYRVKEELKTRSIDFDLEHWDQLARAVTNTDIWTDTGYLKDWPMTIVYGKYPHPLPGDAVTALEDQLWKPEFRIDAAGDDRSLLSWTDIKRSGFQLIVLTEVRIGDATLTLPESRTWLKAEQDEIELPFSPVQLQSSPVEIDLILFKFNETAAPEHYQRAIQNARRFGSPMPTPPNERMVKFDDRGDPILLDHHWKRSLTRTVTPSADSD